MADAGIIHRPVESDQKKLKAVWISAEFYTVKIHRNVEDISQLRYALFLE